MKKFSTFFILNLFILNTFLFSLGIEKPDDYNKNSSLQWDWAVGSIEEYDWRGNERVLDIGCGDGKITAFLAENLREGIVIGIDLSAKMIRYASGCFESQKNLFFLEGDAESLPFHQQFDLAVSFCCLHWVADQLKALESCHKSLLPGGRLLVVVPAKVENNLAAVAEKLVRSEKWAPYFQDYKNPRFYFTPEEYAQLTERAGFQSVQTKLSLLTTDFPSRQALKDWLEPLVTFTSHLRADLQEEFLEDVTNVFYSFCTIEKDGRVHMPSLKLEVQAVKPD